MPKVRPGDLRLRLLHKVSFDPSFRCVDEEEKDTLGCGEFFRVDSENYHTLSLGRSIVLLHGKMIVAYATLSMGHLSSQDFFPKDADLDIDSMPDTDFYPALHLLRIAVREGYESQGVGGYLLDRCFVIARALSHYAGCMFLMLETDEAHLSWYTDVNDFINFKNERDQSTGEVVYWCRKRVLVECGFAMDEGVRREILGELELPV